MAADLGRLVATLEARAERFDLTLQRATGRLDDIARKTEAANERMARSSSRLSAVTSGAAKGFAALVTGATAAAGALAYFAVRQVAALDRLGDLSQQTGLTATSLRQLQVGLELNGGTAEQASEGLLTFSRNLGQVEAGTGRLTGLLKKLDPAFLVALKSAGSTEEGLRLISDRIAGARSEQEALTIAMAAFGSAGRQFVLLLKDGAAGVDELRVRLEGLGIGQLDEVTAAAQRFDDQMKLLRGVVTTQFARGLFGVGEGLDSISNALDDRTIKNLGEFSQNMGELVAAMASAEVSELAAWAEFFNSMRKGEGFSAANDAFARLKTTDLLKEELTDLQDRIADTKSALQDLGDTGGALPSPLSGFDLETKNRRSEIEGLREDLRSFEREAKSRQGELRLRGAIPTPASESGAGRFNARVARLPIRSAAEAGEKAPEAAVTKARDKLLRDHEAFVASMREASAGALSEAQKLSLKLAETLGKIGQAPGLTALERTEFQTAAIEEATAAITRAEADALAKQQDAIGGFLDQFGGQAVSQADRIATQVKAALDKIPGLSAEQREALEASARVKAERDTSRTQGGVEQELLQRSASIQSESLAGLSQRTERALAEIEAKLDASDLDQKIAEAFAGNPQKIAALQGENQRLLDQHLDEINSNWDESFQAIGELGNQVFDDFLQGVAEGSDAAAEDMVRAFLLGLARMEAAAIASDLKSNLIGKGGEATSLTGQALGAIAGKLGGGDEGKSEEDSAKSKEAGQSIASELLGALESGSDRLLDAGKGAGSAIVDAGSAILNAGLAAAQAIIAALAAQATTSAVSSSASFLAFVAAAEGGVATPRGLARLERITALAEGGYAPGLRTDRIERIRRIERIPALAQGGYAAPRIERIEHLAERLAPTIRLAEGGAVRPAKVSPRVDRILREIEAGRESEKTQELIRSLTTVERHDLIERLDRSDRKEVRERSSADRLERRLTDRTTDRTDRSADRILTSKSSTERVAESGTERIERVFREIEAGHETEKTRDLIRSLTVKERQQLTERIESSDSKTRLERAGAAHSFERHSDHVERLIGEHTSERLSASSTVFERASRSSSVFDRSSRSDTITALVGEAGTERLLTVERLREIAEQSGGDRAMAVQIAKQTATKLDHPQIRELSAGDIVIPDRKLLSFFARIMPQARAAEGGLSPLQSIRPVSDAIQKSVGEDGGVEFNLTMVNESGVPLGVKKKKIRQSGRRIDALFVVGQSGATDIRTGGEMSREAQRSWGVRVAPRET